MKRWWVVGALVGLASCKMPLASDTAADAATDLTQGEANRDGASDSPREIGVPFPSKPWGYVVEAKIDTTSITGSTSTFTNTFTLWIDPAAGVVVLGEQGLVARSAVTRAGDEWRSSPMFLVKGMSPCTSGGGLTYEHIAFAASESGIVGIADGSGASATSPDTVLPYKFTATLKGVPDVSPPKVSLTTTGMVNPFGTTYLSSDEPLPDDTKAEVKGPVTFPLDPTGSVAGAVAAFSSGRVLKFASTFSVAISPMLRDLAGNLGSPDELPSFTTLADPGLLAEDGFEGPVAAYLGGASVVNASVLPPISGTASLLVPPASRFTARMAVNPGDRVVRATIRIALADTSLKTFWGSILIAYPGGTPSGVSAVAAAEPLTSTKHPFIRYLGAATTLELPLPEGPGPEILIDIKGPQACPPPSPLVGLLIDDLRVE